jgi:hypothetical protein
MALNASDFDGQCYYYVSMPDTDATIGTPGQSSWSFDPTGGQSATPAAPSGDIDSAFKLPATYFLGADGTKPAAANIFSGQYDAGAPTPSKNPLEAAAADLDQTLQHPGGSPVGINAGDRAVQIAPQGGIIPGLVDSVEMRPYVEGVPGMGPPGMPAPWESGH